MKPLRRYSIALTLASTIALAACVTSSHSSHVLTGTARPAIAPGEVSVLPQVPEQFEEIAEIKATSGVSLRSAKDKWEQAIEALRKEAARLGANAILLEYDDDNTGDTTVLTSVGGTTTMSDGSVVDFDFDSSTRLSESVRGLAIYVPAEGGTFVVPVTINGTMTLDFALNSGAPEVTIPTDVFETLRRTGTISEADQLPPGEYVQTDGSASSAARFRIRVLKVGDTELRDVMAAVSPRKGYLVLGQSFLSRVGILTWSVDNQRHVLVVNGSLAVPPRSDTDGGEAASAEIPPPPDLSGQVTELLRPRGAMQTTTQGPLEPNPRAQAKEAKGKPAGTRAGGEHRPEPRAEGNPPGKAAGVLREP